MGFESGVLLIDTHLGLRGIIDYSTVNRRVMGFELGVLLIDVSWKVIAGELEYALSNSEPATMAIEYRIVSLLQWHLKCLYVVMAYQLWEQILDTSALTTEARC